MFDMHHHTREFKQTTTIHEHRAPTDASLKLLDEMHEKTLDKIISRHSLIENEFKAEWYVLQQNHMSDLEVVCRFNLNGQMRKFSVQICPLDIGRNPHEVAKKVHERVVQEISMIVTSELFLKSREFGKLLRGY